MNQIFSKKMIYIFLVLVILVSIIFTTINNLNNTGLFSLTTHDKVTIGASLALSGKAASWGEDVKNGIELALKHIREREEPAINVLFDDTASSSEKAVTSSVRFIEQENANIIFAVTSEEVLALAPLTESKKVILITSVAGSDDIDKIGDYIFRNREPSKLTSIALANYLLDLNQKEVALIVAQSPGPATYEAAFIEYFTSKGGKVKYTHKYPEITPDIRAGIVAIKEQKIPAVYLIPAKDKDGAELIKQLKELGFEGIVLGGPVFETKKFIEATKNASEGLILAVPFVNKNAPNADQIISEYEATYNELITFSAANAYDITMLINNAAKECKSDTNCISNYLYSTKNYPGVGGNTTFNRQGGVTKSLVYKTIKDQEFVLLPNKTH